MKIRTKLTLAFCLVTFIPVGIFDVLVRRVVISHAETEYAETFAAMSADIAREIAARKLAAQTRLAALARRDNLYMAAIQRLFDPIADEEAIARVIAISAKSEMLAAQLDALTIVDDQDRILACGEEPGRAGLLDVDVGKNVAHRTQPHLETIRARAENGMRTKIIAVAYGSVALGEHRAVRLAAGVELGQALLQSLRVPARLALPDGTVVAGVAGDGSTRSFDIPLTGGQGETIGTLTIWLSTDGVTRTLQFMRAVSLALVILGIGLALSVGAIVAHRITAPLRDLVEGARAVAGGSWETQVPVVSRDEVGELARSFNHMTSSLKHTEANLARAERVAAWREIAQRLAHELKNPLTPIQMAMETLIKARERADTKKFDELFVESGATILEEVQRLRRIVAEFAQFARVPAPQFSAVDVNDVAQKVVALHASTAPFLHAQLHANAPAHADREQLVAVLTNLVQNAIDAVAGIASPAVGVITRATADRVMLVVEDNGAGMSEEVRAKIFTPYFTTKVHGTGLGLAIVERIVTEHHGETIIEAIPTGGTRVTVSLRRAM